MRPIYLLSDSQLLFWKNGDRPFLERLLADLEGENPTAAYIGASNGDDPEYFNIFEAAMERIGIEHSSMVRSEPTDAEMRLLEEADLILLAGGDVLRGWKTIQSNGVGDAVARRYYEGAVLCGVSAGAVQLGWGTEHGGSNGDRQSVNTFRFVPCIIDVHGEKDRWKRLKRALRGLEAPVKGIGIPHGAGMVFRSEDNSIEPIRCPLHELVVSKEVIEERLLFPLHGRSSPAQGGCLEDQEGGNVNGRNG